MYYKPVKKPARVGFLAAQFDDPYQNAVWNGAVEEASALGLTVVFYVSTGRGRNAFDLAEKNDLSALIVMTNSMGAAVTQTRIAEYFTRFTSIPLISIGIDFPGFPSVRSSNRGCVATLTEHLVVAHGRRQFLFLAGTAGHPEATERAREFEETHRRLLPDAEPRFVTCDFLEENAYNRVKELLADGATFDAVVAANDLMAMGAIRALEENGVAVPSLVSVTGYDNIEESFLSIPPITTVLQPMGTLGSRAMKYVAWKLGLLAREPDIEAIRPTCVMRSSCGCKPRNAGKKEPYAPDARHAPTREQTMERRLRYQFSQRAFAEARYSLLRDFESSLAGAFDMTSLLTAIADGVSRQSLGFLALVLFETPGRIMDWSRLMLIVDEKGARKLAPYGLKFKTREILPGGLPEDFMNFVCEPLEFADEAMGYLVCSSDAPDRHMYDALRDQLSAAIKRTLLMERERDRERALEREVRRRTREISLANGRLTDEMSERARLERELLDISNKLMTRIGQDIHDDLCQDIAGISVLGATLAASLRREGHAQADLAARITETASQTAQHAKLIARELYPADFASNGIVSAITHLVNARRASSAAEIDLEIQEGFFVHESEKSIQLYRIAQEAFANALRHAKAKRVKIGLYMNREMIDVVVEDDGRGMPPEAEAGNGMGLKILKYRANVIGATLRIQSNENGTVVTCRVAR